MIGKRISRFDLVEELGRGGMGVVYKGRDTQLHRFVALKFLSDTLANDPAASARFLQEARASAALEHVNVCSIFEIGESDERAPYIVMAFCDGSSLRDLLAARSLEPVEAASLARQIASGLAHAHRNGIVHRDLKPGNVMVTNAGVAKIVDFGIANLRESTTMVGDDVQLGTPAYMSPEQLRGDPSDHRSDIWSFGVLLYEMFTGLNPFAGGYNQASIYNVLNVDPPTVQSVRPDLPAGWAAVVHKCLERDPDARFETFDTVLEALPKGVSGDTEGRARGAFSGYMPKAGSRVYIDRRAEEEHLRRRLSASSGTTTLVYGESGIGKTQFVSRVLSAQLNDGGRSLWGRCLFNEGALPYHPFVTALKNGFPANSDVAAEIEALAMPAGIDFRGRRSHLRALFSVSDDSQEVLNREQLWHTMLLVYSILSSRERPLFVVVDDLQWADSATLALFCYLARSIEQSNIHLVGLYRLESTGSGGADLITESLRQLRIEGLAEQIELNRFDRSESDLLVERMLEGDAVDEALKTHVFDQSEGLPLFLAESLNLLRLEGRITEVDGVWTLAGKASQRSTVSDRIQDIILQRLAVLEEEDRELLEVAAIEGEVFSSKALQACVEWPRIRILKRLQAIEKKHQLIMHEPDGYRFDHTMVRQVLYDSILPELRQEYHRLIASDLASRHGQEDDYAAPIARHLVASGQEIASLPYLLRAADRARSVRAYESALGSFEEIDRIRRSAGIEDAALSVAIARGLGDVRYALGDVQQAADYFARYADLARGAGDTKAELEARRRLADSLRVTGHLDEALEIAEKALGIAQSLDQSEETLRVLHTLAEVWASRGAYQKSAEYAARALDQAAEQNDRANQSIAESILGFAYWHMGSFQRSEEYFSKALDTQRTIGDRLGMATTLNFRALSLWKLARFEAAIRSARESVEVKRRISLLRAVPGSLNIIGDVYRDAFALDKAIEVHNESLELATAHDNKGGMCDNLRDLGADYLEKGDLATAEQFMRKALALAETSGIKWYETRSCIGLAETLARSGDLQQARVFADRGMRLADEIDAKELLIDAKWTLAMVLGDEPDRRGSLLEEALRGADELELKAMAWRLRVDLADVRGGQGNRSEEKRLRTEARELAASIADAIDDKHLREGFLNSSQVARTRGS